MREQSSPLCDPAARSLVPRRGRGAKRKEVPLWTAVVKGAPGLVGYKLALLGEWEGRGCSEQEIEVPAYGAVCEQVWTLAWTPWQDLWLMSELLMVSGVPRAGDWSHPKSVRLNGFHIQGPPHWYIVGWLLSTGYGVPRGTRTAGSGGPRWW